MNGEFTENTKKILAKRAGEKCSICVKSTSKPHSSIDSSFINLGEAAHIKGNKPGKHTRFDLSMSDEERADIVNGIWLCLMCHKQIDSDSNKFTVNFLREAKRKHENKIFLGEFDVNWKEFKQLEKRVSDLEKLISEKENNYDFQKNVLSKEVNGLRLELERAINERDVFKKSLDNLKNTIAGLDLTNASSNTSVILNAYKKGDIAKVKEALAEDKLLFDENELAKKRLLKANVFELEKDYLNAESNYAKAYALNQSREYFDYYIGFLKRKGKNESAIQLCIAKLNDEIGQNFRIFLNSALGELHCDLNKSHQGIHYFTNAKDLIEASLKTNPNLSKLELAKIYSALGIAKKNIGEFDLALLDFQESLNIFWNMSIHDGITHVKELAKLFNSIGLLYLENFDTNEALLYLLKAKNAFEEDIEKDELSLSAVYLNLIDVYSYQKLEIHQSRNYIETAKNIIYKAFSNRPLLFLEFYLAVLVKSADNYVASNKLSEAENEYLLAVELAEDFKLNHNIFPTSTLTTVYFNYAVYLSIKGNIQKSFEYTDKSIAIFLTYDDSEHDKNINLTKLYMFKAELSDDKTQIKDFLEKSQLYISRCKDVNVTKIWKYKVQHAIQNFV